MENKGFGLLESTCYANSTPGPRGLSQFFLLDLNMLDLWILGDKKRPRPRAVKLDGFGPGQLQVHPTMWIGFAKVRYPDRVPMECPPSTLKVRDNRRTKNIQPPGPTHPSFY